MTSLPADMATSPTRLALSSGDGNRSGRWQMMFRQQTPLAG